MPVSNESKQSTVILEQIMKRNILAVLMQWVCTHRYQQIIPLPLLSTAFTNDFTLLNINLWNDLCDLRMILPNFLVEFESNIFQQVCGLSMGSTLSLNYPIVHGLNRTTRVVILPTPSHYSSDISMIVSLYYLPNGCWTPFDYSQFSTSKNRISTWASVLTKTV